MRPFRVPPLYEALMVAAMTAATLAPWQVFVTLAVLAAVILPFAGMGSEQSFTAFNAPLTRWLLLPLIPVAIGISFVEVRGMEDFLAPACTRNTICGLFLWLPSDFSFVTGGYTFRGLVIGYIVSRFYIFSIILAKFTMRKVSKPFLMLTLYAGIFFIPVIFVGIHLEDSGFVLNSLFVFTTFMLSYLAYAPLIGFIAYLCSLGRR